MDNIPTQMELPWPVIRALQQLGGSGSIEEIDSQVIADEGFDEETQSRLHGAGPRTEIQYRLAWARTYLKNAGLVVNSKRGVWALTELGRNANNTTTNGLVSAWRRQKDAGEIRTLPQEIGQDKSMSESANLASHTGENVTVDEPEFDWKNDLLSELLRLDPYEFEHLTRRLLREEGFSNTVVTQRSRDGGIDGVGTFRISLISFRVFFQCKRYSGSVRASEVRDFRGAMAGRGDKGLLITTGTFTNDAKIEADREGATPIELIDGDRLCDLLRERELGVTTEERRIEVVSVDRDFFRAGF